MRFDDTLLTRMKSTSCCTIPRRMNRLDKIDREVAGRSSLCTSEASTTSKVPSRGIRVRSFSYSSIGGSVPRLPIQKVLFQQVLVNKPRRHIIHRKETHTFHSIFSIAKHIVWSTQRLRDDGRVRVQS